MTQFCSGEGVFGNLISDVGFAADNQSSIGEQWGATGMHGGAIDKLAGGFSSLSTILQTQRG
jgi:hypothetical protein